VVDRRFWAANGRRAEFEAAFSLGGTWSRLLIAADGYLVSEFWCESPGSGQYRVKDFWSWHRSFEVFRSRFHAEVERFDEWLRAEMVIEREEFLGAYYERFEDGSDDDLVLS